MKKMERTLFKQFVLFTKSRQSETFSSGFILLGLLVLMVGSREYFVSHKTADTKGRMNTSITQRYFATEQAKREGRKEYSFTTSFIPGMGIITDPQAYIDKLQKK